MANVVACAPSGALTHSQRKRLPASAFALPSLRKFPLYKLIGGELLPSRSHAINAKARAQQSYNRGEISGSTLSSIDRKADRVIKECDMAKAKKTTKKRASKKRTPAQIAATKRLVAMNKARAKKKASKKKAKKTTKTVRKVVRETIDTTTRTTRKKATKKKASKKVVKKKTTKKVTRKRRTPAQIAATKRLIAANKARAKKKTAKKTTTKRKAAKKAPSRKRRTVKARYETGKNMRGVRVKVAGSKTRVPVEVRDIPSIKNRVIVLV